MNYIVEVKKRLHEALNMEEAYLGLLDVYALLVFTKGKDCTSEDVHDAWSIWQNRTQPDHKSLIPFNELTKEVQELDDQYRDAIIKVATKGSGDGYHTIAELYDHRIILYMALCKQIANQPYEENGKYRVWASRIHSDGSEWDGWFIMGVGTKEGEQLTYHLPVKYWEKVAEFAEIIIKAPDFDGHSSQDVLERLGKL